MSKGFFITLEGIDGCGKTTQAGLLAEWLRAQGYDVVLTRQPGGTPKGQQLREMVLSPDHEITPEAELFLYLADRSIHVAEVIALALAAGRIVVGERYTDSTLAYQGYGRGLEMALLRRLNELATGGLTPDLTLVIDIPADAARLDAGRLDRLESAGGGFRERVVCGFRALAAEEPERIVLIDGRPNIETVHAQIVAHVAERLARAASGDSMKLIIAVVQDKDQRKVTDALLERGYQFTNIATTGGLLREGNVTFLIGIDEEHVDDVMQVLRDYSKTHEQLVNVFPPTIEPIGTCIPSPVKVLVGGATVFVVDVERFEKL